MSEPAPPQGPDGGDPFAEQAPDEESELTALSNALDLASGFKLLFVCYQGAEHQQRLLLALRERHPSKSWLALILNEPIEHLLDELRRRLDGQSYDVVHVLGLENSLPDPVNAAQTPLVANLNAARNSFPLNVRCPLVFWVPEYALQAIARGAPDFFSVRSGVFFFEDKNPLLGEVMLRLARLATQKDVPEAVLRGLRKQLLVVTEGTEGSYGNSMWLVFADHCERLGQDDLALDAYQHVLESTQAPYRRAHALIKQGRILIRQGKASRAIRFVSEALELSIYYSLFQREAEARIGLGLAFIRRGDISEARRHLEAAYWQAVDLKQEALAQEAREGLRQAGRVLGREDWDRVLLDWPPTGPDDVVRGAELPAAEMNPRDLRRQLQRAFSTDSDFDNFLFDHFPDIAEQTGSGMNRLERENLLLQQAEPAQILRALEHAERTR